MDTDSFWQMPHAMHVRSKTPSSFSLFRNDRQLACRKREFADVTICTLPDSRQAFQVKFFKKRPLQVKNCR